MDVVSGAASQIFFFFFFPQNPADVDGDQLDVSKASLGSTMLEKNFFSRARESSFGVRDAVLMCDKTGCRRRGKFCFVLYDNVYIHEAESFFIYLKKVARICFSIVELRKKNVTRQVAKLGD